MHSHFQGQCCKKYYKRKLVLTGRGVGLGDLWILLVNGQEQSIAQATAAAKKSPRLAAATATGCIILPQVQAKERRYMHQVFMVIPAPTLEKMIQNDQFCGFS